MNTRLLILCYHNVDPTWCFQAPAGRGRRGLEAQLRALKRFANVVPLADALQLLRSGGDLPPRAVALTFDDGYRDNISVAVPMLEGLHLPATFFLVPGLLTDASVPWWEVVTWSIHRASVPQLEWEDVRLPLRTRRDRERASAIVQERLKTRAVQVRNADTATLRDLLRPNGREPSAENMFLDWDEAGTLLRRGFTVGSHTCAHAILSREAPEHQQADLIESRRQLQERLEVPVDVLAYPNGRPIDYNEHTLAAAEAAGYVAALTTTGGWTTPQTRPLEMRRVVMYPERGIADLLLALRPGPRASSARVGVTAGGSG